MEGRRALHPKLTSARNSKQNGEFAMPDEGLGGKLRRESDLWRISRGKRPLAKQAGLAGFELRS